MDENKNFEMENEEVTEAIEELVEEVTEDTEEITEEVTEAAEEIIEEVAEVAEEATEEIPEVVFAQEDIAEITKKRGIGAKIAIAAGAVVAVIAILTGTIIGIIGWDTFKKFDDSTLLAIKRIVVKNPYNEMGYYNFSGRTIEQVAQDAGMPLADFLEQYALPADMPADTIEEAAYYSIPLGAFAENIYGISIDEFKEFFGLGDDVTEETPYGEAEGKITLRYAIGEESFEDFKAEFGFGDEVTLDTTYGEVRPAIEKQRYEEQMAAEQEAEAQDEEVAE